MASNPNPDRARRAPTSLHAILLQPATTALAPAAAPSPAVIAPAGAQVAAAAPAAPVAPATAPAATLQPVRQTGLAQPLAPRKRTAAPVRDHPAWKCVEMVGGRNDIYDIHDIHGRGYPRYPLWPKGGCFAPPVYPVYPVYLCINTMYLLCISLHFRYSGYVLYK